MSLIKAGLLVGALGVAASAPLGCSDDSGLTNAGFDGGNGGFGGVATGPCKTGDSRKCGIELAKHGDIVSCYVGTQSCSEGVWGECGDGSQITKSVTAPPGVGPGSSAMNATGNCVGNPCDPYCQQYNDDAGVTTDGGTGAPIYNWPGGDIGDLPPGLVSKGLKEPCLEGADCQFNTYCWHPKTSAACGHSKCETGAKLGWGCDPCVKQICKSNQTSCVYPDTVARGGSCTHSICTAGMELAKGCDHPGNTGEDCVQQICDKGGAFADCCKNGMAWTAACVAEVATTCGLNCGQIDNAAGSWDAAAVGKVATVCDATCGAGAPPPEEGKCKEWLPGETDPTCAGINLTADVPCTDTIPVCNHGQTAAPAGVRIVQFPGNSSQFPLCDPDQTGANVDDECFTTAAIPPGECTTAFQHWDSGSSSWKPGCPVQGNNKTIMVNPQVQSVTRPTPPGYPGYQAECSCKDNWTLYDKNATCGPPVCGGDVQVATFKKINYLVMMDRTYSMTMSGLWVPAVAGMKAFYQSAANAGLGVGMEFFPLNPGATTGDGCSPSAPACDPISCSHPMVPLGTLTAAAAPADTQEQALVGAFASPLVPPVLDWGWLFNTCLHPALNGALQWATAQVNANPSEVFDVILLTDGDPTACDTNINNIAGLASAAFAAKGIKTHVIAIPGSSIATLDQIAAAGGTTAAIPVSAGTMAADLVAALSNITGTGITCSSDLPAANLFDPTDVKVEFTPGSGPPAVTLPKRADLTACNGNVNPGWYYDNNGAPTKVLLCPNSCVTAQNDAGSKIELALGCPKRPGSNRVTIPYQAQCPAGTKPQWNFFAYDSTTPNTSTIDFRVRAADTQALLAGATWKNLGTAQSTPTDTQICSLAGPSPCPLDLFATLGSPDQKRSWIELEVTLVSGGGGSPVLNTFDATYSCPPSE